MNLERNLIYGSDFMRGFTQAVIDAGFATAYEIRGCSRREIVRLETDFAVQLPVVYKEFLSVMGRRAGSFYRGTDCFYVHLFDLREQLEALFEEDKSTFSLSKDAFVISGHQGVIFHFFYTIEHQPDPPVWGYCEGDMLPRKINDTFSEFLVAGLEDLKSIPASMRDI